MSITKLPRELGIIIRCNGTQAANHPESHKACPNGMKYQVSIVRVDYTRAAAAKIGWGRGLRKGMKRNDHCPDCMPIERELFAKAKADREAEKLRRDELKKAKFAAPTEPKPKKPRRSRATSNSPAACSPSADSAPAAAT